MIDGVLDFGGVAADFSGVAMWEGEEALRPAATIWSLAGFERRGIAERCLRLEMRFGWEAGYEGMVVDGWDRCGAREWKAVSPLRCGTAVQNLAEGSE